MTKKEKLFRQRIAQKKWRVAHPDAYAISRKQNSNNKAAKGKKVLFELRKKAGNKCSECGYDKHPEILHFHHIKKKHKNVSTIARYSVKNAILEAKKCILLCPNCHAIETIALRVYL